MAPRVPAALPSMEETCWICATLAPIELSDAVGRAMAAEIRRHS
jgi:hypothetical protein